jgi:hypothetical protein
VRYGSTGLIRGEPSVRIVPSNATRVTSNRWLARCAIRGAAVSSSCQVLIGASLLTHAQRILPNVPARVAIRQRWPRPGRSALSIRATQAVRDAAVRGDSRTLAEARSGDLEAACDCRAGARQPRREHTASATASGAVTGRTCARLIVGSHHGRAVGGPPRLTEANVRTP